MTRFLALALLLLSGAARADDAPARLLPLSGLKFTVERVGMFTYVHCEDPKQPDCGLFERLAIQPDVDWDALQAQAAKKRKRKSPVLAKLNVDDQHGGAWTVAVLEPHNGHPAPFLGELTYVIVPTFPGYRVKFDDQARVASAEVVLNEKEWKKALAAQPKPKSGLAKLLE